MGVLAHHVFREDLVGEYTHPTKNCLFNSATNCTGKDEPNEYGRSSMRLLTTEEHDLRAFPLRQIQLDAALHQINSVHRFRGA